MALFKTPPRPSNHGIIQKMPPSKDGIIQNYKQPLLHSKIAPGYHGSIQKIPPIILPPNIPSKN